MKIIFSFFFIYAWAIWTLPVWGINPLPLSHLMHNTAPHVHTGDSGISASPSPCWDGNERGGSFQTLLTHIPPSPREPWGKQVLIPGGSFPLSQTASPAVASWQGSHREAPFPSTSTPELNFSDSLHAHKAQAHSHWDTHPGSAPLQEHSCVSPGHVLSDCWALKESWAAVSSLCTCSTAHSEHSWHNPRLHISPEGPSLPVLRAAKDLFDEHGWAGHAGGQLAQVIVWIELLVFSSLFPSSFCFLLFLCPTAARRTALALTPAPL